jgi:trk system potassium uptake protein TrkA
MARRTFAVIGLGRFGSAMATTLTELGQEVIGVDASEERVRRLADVIHHAVELDATEATALRAAGIADVDVAIVSIGENIEASLLVVMQVKDLGVSTIYAKAVTPLHGRILDRLGVTRVIFPEREMAVRIAHGLAVPGLVDFIELSQDSSIIELPAPPEFAGRTLKELGLRARFGLTLIAIRHREAGGAEKTLVSPGPDDRIEPGDILVLLGSNDAMKRIERLK